MSDAHQEMFLEACREAIAMVTAAREVNKTENISAFPKITITSNVRYFVHALTFVAITALLEVDNLGGDGDALLQFMGVNIADSSITEENPDQEEEGNEH